jgi:hydroxymethylpyrimidine pyrophosphatase-like HAD family hydrolase
MAIGDSFNDLEMLAFARATFIMGHAREELKSHNWPVTRCNDENGVAAASSRYLQQSNLLKNWSTFSTAI